MKETLKSGSVVVIAACLFVTNGCVIAERGQKVTKVEKFPSTERKPSLYVERYEQTESWNNECQRSECVQNVSFANAVRVKRLESSGLFGRVASINFGADYTINLVERKEVRFNRAGRALSFMSIGIIPMVDNRTYALTAYVRDNKTGVVLPVEVNETSEVWNTILLLPAVIFCPSLGDETRIHIDLIDNLAINVHDAIIKHEQRAATISDIKPLVEANPSAEEEGGSLFKKLKALKDAHETGVLTDREYQQKRADTLKGL